MFNININKILTICLFCVAGISLFFPGTACAQQTQTPATAAQTLKDYFILALQNSEKIAISEETVRQAEALYRETLGGSFPKVTYRREASLEDHGDDSQEGMFRITKTDLTGYRELAAIRAGRSTISQRQFERERVEQLLLLDVAQTFYSILSAEENVATTNKLIALAQERLQELEERVRIGRARQADAIAQQALIASLESQGEESTRQVNARRDLLAFLISVATLDHKVQDSPIIMQAQSLENYLGKADTRPDIQAARENLNVVKGDQKLARSEYFPSLNAAANSYTDRPSSQEEVDWDVTLSVDMPLWDWGSRRGTLKAANSVVAQFEKNLQFVTRQADLEIRNAYRDYESAKKQLDIQTKSVELARQNYEIQVEDDHQGLVSNLDVFESLDRLNNAELGFNNARLQEKLTAINLEITSGAKPAEILP